MSRSRDIAKFAGSSSTFVYPTTDGTDGQVLTTDGAGNLLLEAASSSGAGVTSYTNASDLPLSGNTAGDLAYVNETARLYVNNGTGWYNVSLVNTNPSITSVQDANSNTTPFTFATDGTAIVITITASDPEEVPLTYSYSVTSGSLTNGGGTTATVSQGTGANTNVFTITPTTTQAYAGSFTLTFTASDGINQATSANVFSLQFTIVDSKYTSLLVQADASSSDNQTDASSNSLTITETGNVTSTALSPYHPKGYSTYFDGTSDYLVIDDTAIQTMSSSGFCFELWVYGVPNGSFLTWNVGSGVDGFYIGNGGGVYLSSNSSSWDVFSNVAIGLTANQWNHVALTWDTTTYRYLVNGSVVASAANSTAMYSSGTAKLGVGATATGAVACTNEFYVRDLRFTNGDAVYTGSYTVPDEPLTVGSNTELLVCSEPYLKDVSGNDCSITVTTAVEQKLFSPYDQSASYSKSSHGGSIYMDGNGDELSLSPSASELVFGTDAYTVEFWINPSSTPSGNAHVYGANSTNGFLVYYTSSKIAVNKYGVSDVISYAETPPLNQWTHYAFVREGTGTNQTKIYKNGVVVATSTDATTWATNTNWTVGGNPASVQDVNGYLSDIRVVKGTAVYTSAFTPPTSPLTAITNTQLLTCTNKHEVWDAASGELPSISGNTTASTTQYKWSDSIYLDGSGDFVNLNFKAHGTEDFTYECWLYPTSLGSYGSAWSSGGEVAGTGVIVSADQWWLGNGSSVNQFVSGNKFTLNTWQHVAVVRNGTTVTGYVDGTSVGSATISVSLTSTQVRLGSRYYDNSSYLMAGYIEDFRLTQGLARYTSNFTAPSAAFEG